MRHSGELRLGRSGRQDGASSVAEGVVSGHLVSCIVPVYNGERYVAEALDSILSQSYAPVEVIVVDDGSEDGTAGVLSGYGRRIRCVRQENAGPAAARNRGLAESAGDLVAFLDADDLWHREKLARQVDHLGRSPECDLCTTHWRYIWAEELSEEAEQFWGHPLEGPLAGYMLQTLLTRRTVFEEIGPFDPSLRYGEDHEWFTRASDAGKTLCTLPDVLACRRVHPDSMLHRDPDAFRASFFGFVKRHLDRQRSANRRAAEASRPGADATGQQE